MLAVANKMSFITRLVRSVVVEVLLWVRAFTFNVGLSFCNVLPQPKFRY